jgi:hypothetical protein
MRCGDSGVGDGGFRGKCPLTRNTSRGDVFRYSTTGGTIRFL